MIEKLICALLYSRSYNKPTRYGILACQWLHQGFLWGWWSYETYLKWQDKIPTNACIEKGEG